MINFFAKTNFRNQERKFGIKKDDRRRHMYIIGKTGVGKSNLMENMAIQDIRGGEGVCYVDPHGEGAEKMMQSIPSERINDIVYFNPADSDFPVAFNILEAVNEDKKNLVASGMMGVFKKIWPDVWSPRMEYILNNTILALLDYPGSTMLGVNRMMSDKDYRKRVYPKIKDPVVKSFWINEFDQWEDRFRKEAVAAIQNKVGQFLSSPVIRHIVGQPKSTIDMQEIMDSGKILIVNLSKGRIGEDAMRLLGGMVVTKIQLAAMSRVMISEEKRKDFYLYVDEFQNFATESFANILSEARKYRLSLILAHQYINQLVFDGNSTVRDAVFGNVGTIVSFRVGAEDAEALEKEFEPVFTMNDLVNLAKYNIYLKLMIDGIAGDAFSATTLPPMDISDTKGNQEKAIKVSRERYGRSRAEIEEKIARWSGMFEFDDLEKSGPSQAVAKEERKITSINPKTNQYFVPKTIPAPAFQANKKPVSAKGDSSKNQEDSKQKDLLASRTGRDDFSGPSIVSVPPTIQKPATPVVSSDDFSEGDKKKDRSMFEAICATCEEKILVPFQPDPKRPTFCKECLKDYQRARARAQNENKEKRDKPISLLQISRLSPKKFERPRKKTQINLEEVRSLIKETKNGQSNE